MKSTCTSLIHSVFPVNLRLCIKDDILSMVRVEVRVRYRIRVRVVTVSIRVRNHSALVFRILPICNFPHSAFYRWPISI